MLVSRDPFQTQVARAALSATREYGFVLGGGQALIAHGIVDRPTEDIDLFTDRTDAVANAAAVLETALRAAGYAVSRMPAVEELGGMFEGFDDGMAELEISAGPQVVRLTLAHLSRERSPVVLDIGPVMDLGDCVGSKVAAAVGRGEIRDFIDMAAATERYTVTEMIGLAREMDRGLSEDDFAEAGRRLDGLKDDRFRRYGLSADATAEVRRRLANWPR